MKHLIPFFAALIALAAICAPATAATTNFFSTAPGIVFSPINSWFDFASGGHDERQMKGTDSRIDCVMTGTSATMAISTSSASAVSVQIDGGAVTPLTVSPANLTWTTVTLFTGLTDTVHEVSVIFSGNTNTFIERDTNSGLFQVTGSAPAISTAAQLTTGGFTTQAAWLSGLSGQQWDFHDNVGSFSLEGMSFAPGTGNYNIYGVAFNDAVFRFRCAGNFSLWTYFGGGSFKVSVDGAPEAGPYTLPSTNSYGWWSPFTPPDNNEHEYAFSTVNSSLIGEYFYAVRSDSGAGYNAYAGLYPAVPNKTVIAAYGDSITQSNVVGSAYIFPDSTGGYVHQFYTANLHTVMAVNRAAQGTTVHTTGSTHTAEITGLSPQPNICFILYGTNDISTGNAPAQFQSDEYTMLNLLTQNSPKTRYIILGLIPRGDTWTAMIPAYTGAIHSVLFDQGDGAGHHLSSAQLAQITYIDPVAWNLTNGGADFKTNYDVDNIHPNAAGQVLIYNHLYALTRLTFRHGLGPRAGSRSNQNDN